MEGERLVNGMIWMNKSSLDFTVKIFLEYSSTLSNPTKCALEKNNLVKNELVNKWKGRDR